MLYIHPTDPSVHAKRLVESAVWPSDVDAALVEAYLDARFASSPAGFDFSIREAPSLASLLPGRALSSAAILTAFNPGSAAERAPQANLAANAELRSDLAKLGLDVLDAQGRDPRGAWPAEPSFFALGVSRADAMVLGKKYGQNAIVWFESAGASPTLLLLR